MEINIYKVQKCLSTNNFDGRDWMVVDRRCYIAVGFYKTEDAANIAMQQMVEQRLTAVNRMQSAAR